MTRADPSVPNDTSAHVSAAASERRSMASRMTDASAISNLTAAAGLAGPLGPTARSRAPQLGSLTDGGQPLLRERGSLFRGAALASRPAGQSAQHPAHPFVVARVRVSGVGVMVANRGAVQAERCGRQAVGGPFGEVRRHRIR